MHHRSLDMRQKITQRAQLAVILRMNPICGEYGTVAGLHRVPVLLLPQHGGAEHPEAPLAALADGQVD
jgi:hypothetical protein